MRRLLVVLLVAGCGNVKAVSDAGAPDAGARPGSVAWQQSIFGSFADKLVVVDKDLYLGASAFSQMTLGKDTLVPAGGTDVMYAHFTTDGAVQAAWRHGAASNEDTIGFAIDPFGNVAVGGLYDSVGTANFGGADLPPAPASNFEAVAASYTPAGTLRWQTPITGTTLAFPGAASTNSTGLTSVTGRFSGTLTVGTQTRMAAGGTDIFYATFDDKGNVVTLTSFGGPGDDMASTAIFDPLNTVILVGTFTGQVAFGAFMLDAGTGTSVFVVRMSPQGTPMWAIQGSTAGAGQTIAATTPAGDIVLAAAYRGTFQLPGGDLVTSAGDLDVALAKISSDGKVAWTRSFGGAGPDQPRAVAVGRNGEIALTGEFEGQATFGGDPVTSVGGLDAVVAKYTATGAHVWSRAAGSTSVDRGLGVAVDAAGAVYAGISFHNTIDFGGGPVSAAGTDYGGALIRFNP